MEPVKVALSSYGMSGIVFHGPLLESHPGFEITKIVERQGKNSSGKHPGALLVRDFNEILEDPDIELVIINTPDHLHHEMSLSALEAGKHIVVEKPFTLRSAEADQIIDTAAKKDLMVSVFQNRRWDGDFLTIKNVIESGRLGRLVSFESHFDRFRNYIQDSWKEKSSNGTGTLYNLGSHMIDQALQLFGLPISVYADVRALRTGSIVDDSFDVVMHYPSVKCMVRGSYLVKSPGPRYILHGTEGSFLKYGLDPQEEHLKAGVSPRSDNWGEEPESSWGEITIDKDGKDLKEYIPTLPGNYAAYYDNIHDHLRKGSKLAVTANSARDVIRIIEAAYESAKNVQSIAL